MYSILLTTCQKKFYSNFLSLSIAIVTFSSLCAQPTIAHISVENVNNQYLLNNIHIKDKNWNLAPPKIPFFSLKIDDQLFQSGKILDQKLEVSFEILENFPSAFEFIIRLANISNDTLKISNIVPLGQSSERMYLTASGPSSLSRTKIFRPGLSPVPVIVPDNAWELGYSAVELDEQYRLCGLARRTKYEKAQRRRFETYLYPQGYIEYNLFFELYEGEWQEGLRKIFQERYLYDLAKFDETLFERKDLEWIRHDYIIHLMMGWDRQFYDPKDKTFHIQNFLNRGQKWYGGDDA